MKLPEKFQFQVKGEPGYTHTIKLDEGMYKVKWARGFERYFLGKHNLPSIPINIWAAYSVQRQIETERWIIVDQPEAKQEGALPDKFHFHCCERSGTIYKANRIGNQFDVTWEDMLPDIPVFYEEEQLISRFKSGDWKIYLPITLTAEQLHTNAEAREQISALEHNIKLRKQDVEHAQILIANYEGRVKELESKIVEE